MPRRALTAGQGGVGSFHLSQKGGEMRFGNDDVGSSFPPRDEHDESANAKFNLIPRTVTIAEGGIVTYDIFVRFGFHQPKVYDVGRHPKTSTSSSRSSTRARAWSPRDRA